MNVKKTKKFKENRPENYHVHDKGEGRNWPGTNGKASGHHQSTVVSTSSIIAPIKAQSFQHQKGIAWKVMETSRRIK